MYNRMVKYIFMRPYEIDKYLFIKPYVKGNGQKSIRTALVYGHRYMVKSTWTKVYGLWI